MTNNQLFAKAHRRSAYAHLLLDAMKSDQSLRQSDIRQVREDLTTALASITELERRAAGVPEPKVG